MEQYGPTVDELNSGIRVFGLDEIRFIHTDNTFEEDDQWWRTKVINTTKTVSFSVNMTYTNESAQRLIFGFSRKQWRIFKGREKKQLIHKGRKP